MVTDTAPKRTEKLGPSDLISAAVAGVAGGIAFALLTAELAPEQIENIGVLYGMGENPAIGLYIHLVHSFAIGMVYAWLVGFASLHGFATRMTTGASLGVAFGLLLWLVAASVLMPLWLGAVSARSPQVPDFDEIYFVGHVVYGVILGGGYPLVLSQMPDAHGRR